MRIVRNPEEYKGAAGERAIVFGSVGELERASSQI
jgi:hypothetical protein